MNLACEAAEYYLNSWNDRQITIDEKGYLAVIKNEEPRVGEGDDAKRNGECYAVFKGEPVRFRIEVVRDGIKQAVELAKKAQKVVIAIGSNPVINSKEEMDRTTLALPPAQQRLVDAVYEVNDRVAVVMVTNYPYSVVDMQKTIPAILYAPSGSQELGTGIASIISGETSPAARLAMTWYRSDEDLPDIQDYDIIQGKRTYQYFEGEVLYPFGHGLSYTEFQYDTMTIEPKENAIRIKLRIKNTGTVTADEVVQLYVHKEMSRVKQPIKQLRGFERVKQLRPGESREVVFHVECRDLCYYDVVSQKMRLESSVYTFMAGASSLDIRQKASVEIKGDEFTQRNPFDKIDAVLFDRSSNCFVHKGIGNGTCMIPGRPGDIPDEVDLHGNVSCQLEYDDVCFLHVPRKAILHLYALEDGEIRISGIERESAQVVFAKVAQIEKMSDFQAFTIELQRTGLTLGKTYTLRIELAGKIKLADFMFV